MSLDIEGEFKQLCLDNGMQEGDVTILCRDYGICSIKTMAMFFEPEEVKANFRAQLFDLSLIHI